MILYNGVEVDVYDDYDKNGELYSNEIHDEFEVYVNGQMINEADKKSRLFTILHLSNEDKTFTLHRTDGPAYEEIENGNRTVYFHHNGINVKIEDMPVDEETKVYWILKYGSCLGESSFYYGYSSDVNGGV